MSDRLAGRVALVTGGAQGIGAATARRLASAGARVAVADVRDDAAAALAGELGDSAIAVHLDVRDEGEWAMAGAAIEERFGSWNVLVNNAGVMHFGDIEHTSRADFTRVLEVNLVGVFLGIRAAIGPMRRAGGGAIVNLSSIQGLTGAPVVPAYVASKFGVRGLTKAAAMELGPLGIRVNSVHPGAVDTEMTSPGTTGGFDVRPALASVTPLQRIAAPEEIAALIAFLVSDESSYCTGAEFVVDGGITAGMQLPTLS